jgi:hypothetical protein
MKRLLVLSMLLLGIVARPSAQSPFVVMCDGNTDATAIIQYAIDSFGDTTQFRAGRIQLVGVCPISRTLIVQKRSVLIEGVSWASSLGNGGSALKWVGAAGIPELRLWADYGSGVRNLRFIGNSASPPSAALSLYQGPNDGSPNAHNTFSDLWIGSLDGYDTDDNQQFAAGIVFEGTNVNNDLNTFRNIRINKVGVGIDVQQTQFGINEFENLQISSSSIAAIRNAGTLQIRNAFFGNNPVDYLAFPGPAQPAIRCYGCSSEGAGRLADLTGASGGSLLYDGGYWQVSTKLHADGKVIKANDNRAYSVVVTDFSFAAVTGYAGQLPIVDLSHTSAVRRIAEFRLRDHSIGAANFLLSSVDHPDSFGVITFSSTAEWWNYLTGSGQGNLFSFTPSPTHRIQ